MIPWNKSIYGIYVTLDEDEKYMMYFRSAVDGICWIWGHGHRDYQLYFPSYILN